MGEIINLHGDSDSRSNNLIVSTPLEFRRADWSTPNFIQMLRALSSKLEKEPKGSLPPHYSLEGGTAFTIRALYAHRKDEASMKEVYYLAGLLDCMINQVNPVLRTDLLRDMYKKIFSMKEALGVNWYGPLDRVLLPLGPWLYDEQAYRASLSGAGTMKALYQAIRKGTDEMFRILSLEYVFYCPNLGG